VLHNARTDRSGMYIDQAVIMCIYIFKMKLIKNIKFRISATDRPVHPSGRTLRKTKPKVSCKVNI